MSVTVNDLMRVPSLRQAKVLAGHRGLGKIVSSISVLESTDPDVLVADRFPKGEFFGSEIVITGFLNIVNDIELQCENIRQLSAGGEVGLILYYVGVFMPEVDHRLIELADELDFVLICMPTGDPTLRYSEVINDVMGCIFRDQEKKDSIVLDILEQISALPKHRQSVDTAMRILSDRIAASVILCDSAFHILNLAAWPRSQKTIIEDGILNCSVFPESRQSCPCTFQAGHNLQRLTIRTDSGQKYELLILRADTALKDNLLDEIEEATCICINIWGKKHDDVAVHELVRAILKDEPMKMHRLAEIFRVDIDSLHEMWILDNGRDTTNDDLKAQMPALRDCFARYTGSFIMDFYGGRLIVFMSPPRSQQETEQLEQEILTLTDRCDPNITLARCNQLQTTADVRKAYLCYKEMLSQVRKIYPNRKNFSYGQLEFAQSCHRTILDGEAGLNRCLLPLRPLKEETEDMDLVQTLATYLLDGDSSVTKTAQLLYLHKNTVKYRIKRISDILGFRPDRMPEVVELYKAAAVQRILS